LAYRAVILAFFKIDFENISYMFKFGYFENMFNFKCFKLLIKTYRQSRLQYRQKQVTFREKEREKEKQRT